MEKERGRETVIKLEGGESERVIGGETEGGGRGRDIGRKKDRI